MLKLGEERMQIIPEFCIIFQFIHVFSFLFTVSVDSLVTFVREGFFAKNFSWEYLYSHEKYWIFTQGLYVW